MESVSIKALWSTHFPEFIQAGEAGINSLMASAKLVELPAGQPLKILETEL